MANEPSVEEIALEQRATDPRTEQSVETNQQDNELAPSTEENTETPPAPILEEPPVKPKKTAEEVLKGRVGHLTKTLSQKDQDLEDVRSRLAAAESLLASNSGAPPDAANLKPTTTSAPPSVYTPADFEAAVAARTEAQDFNRRADELYNSGSAKYQDWKDAVDSLVVSGFMNKDLLDAAMAVEDGPTVLHYLGTNLDEAERISALPPIRKATEIAKLSNTLTAPKSVPVSAAPTPIKPVSGSPSPAIDLHRIADSDDMRAYAAARAKQGSKWARA